MKNQTISLVIMAAGIGSRFGEGIKQLAPVTQHGEIIMDYSIHDAISAGFNKIIFIIRKDIEKDFKEVIGNRIESICQELGVETAYVFQELDDLPQGFSVPEGRTKPWGTGQAVLACKDIINEPFVVLNADDYYGKEAFFKMYDYLTQEETGSLCMAGFMLENTLSKNGGVTRGICKLNKHNFLTSVVETYNIAKAGDKIELNGNIISPDTYASMNMWGLTPDFINELENGFIEFLEGIEGRETTAEYLLPTIIGGLLDQSKISVKVLPTSDKWFGVTYKEDKPLVFQSIQELIKEGKYKEVLYSDLQKKKQGV